MDSKKKMVKMNLFSKQKQLGDPGLGEAQQLQGGQLHGRPNATLDIQCWRSGLARRLESGDFDSGEGIQKLAGSRSWAWGERIF